MGEISDQLAARLPADTIRFGADVTEIDDHHVIVDDSKVEAQAVVVATDASDATRLTGGEVPDPGTNGLTTWWFAAPETPMRRPMIVLDGNGNAAFNNLAVLSQASSDYSPDDRALVAVSAPATDIAETDVRRSLTEWYGGGVEEWETLRVDVIRNAQPKQPWARSGPVGADGIGAFRRGRSPTARPRSTVRSPRDVAPPKP